jgi:RNA polymerase sigma-70 factor, ECF subfamily
LDNEKDFIEKAKNNPKVFGELYDQYYPRIFGYIFRITGDYAVACDITSETFLKVWMKIGGFRWKGFSISSWIFKIATNELNQYFRKKKYTPHTLLDLAIIDRDTRANPPYVNDSTNETITRLDQAEEFMNLHRELTMLPSKYQTVIALRYFEEMSIAQISQILAKKEGTVKSHLSRGLDRLKNNF